MERSNGSGRGRTDAGVRGPAGPTLLAALAIFGVAVVHGQANAGAQAGRESVDSPRGGGEAQLVDGQTLGLSLIHI